MNELQASIEFAFAVFPEPPALFHPSEGAFDDPAFGQHRKGVQFVALDDLHRSVQALFDAVCKWLSAVSTIDQHAFHSLQIRPAAVEGLQGPAAIRHLGRGDGNRMRKTLRIDSDMALDARDFFARVVTLLLRRYRCSSRSARQQSRSWSWRCVPVWLGPRQPVFFKARSRTLIPSGPGSLHRAKYECTVRHWGNPSGSIRH